uniref:PlxyGVORF34 protein n=1 Tax=Plutella xylostella granulovirus TaxID=98383 RepID=A0A1B2CSE4_9BBAC|nr:PlxyGVORF34 protein [Plutella xylostella granulovirus]
MDAENLNNKLTINNWALEAAIRQNRDLIDQLQQIKQQYEKEKSFWKNLEQSYNDTISTLVRQINATSDENDIFKNENLRLTNLVRDQNAADIKVAKKLKKRVREIKRLRGHIENTNIILENVIVDSDKLLDEM